MHVFLRRCIVLQYRKCVIHRTIVYDYHFKLIFLQGKRIDAINIENIEALSYFTGLTFLELDDNRISDLTPLENLKELQRLRLSGNQIKDISPLSVLDDLWELELDYNQIEDVSALEGLHNLEILWIDGNRVADIDPLCTLVNLRELYMDHNTISDLSPLYGLSSLETIVLDEIDAQEIEDLQDHLPDTYLWRISGEETEVERNTDKTGETPTSAEEEENNPEPLEMDLADLDWFNASDNEGGLVVLSSVRDNFGRVYENGFGGNKNGVANWREFKLGGEYKRLTGTVVMNYNYRTEESSGTYVRIWGDDTCLYESQDVTAGIGPQGFDVDLTGVDVLRLTIIGANYSRVVDCVITR